MLSTDTFAFEVVATIVPEVHPIRQIYIRLCAGRQKVRAQSTGARLKTKSFGI
ncbi:hypothetical protein N183_30230 [Sinorhizobium sp. Sb3]|nr:hypothetical protein N183_30230 [Sinorhizobium sp. Sb3]